MTSYISRGREPSIESILVYRESRWKSRLKSQLILNNRWRDLLSLLLIYFDISDERCARIRWECDQRGRECRDKWNDHWWKGKSFLSTTSWWFSCCIIRDIPKERLTVLFNDCLNQARSASASSSSSCEAGRIIADYSSSHYPGSHPCLIVFTYVWFREIEERYVKLGKRLYHKAIAGISEEMSGNVLLHQRCAVVVRILCRHRDREEEG